MRLIPQTHRICPEHRKLLRIEAEDGTAWRFCLQCAKLHTIDQFGGDRRSCQASLLARRQRKRERQRAEQEDREDSLRYSRRCASHRLAAAASASQMSGRCMERGGSSELSGGTPTAARQPSPWEWPHSQAGSQRCSASGLGGAPQPGRLESCASWRSSGTPAWRPATPEDGSAGAMTHLQQGADGQQMIVVVQLNPPAGGAAARQPPHAALQQQQQQHSAQPQLHHLQQHYTPQRPAQQAAAAPPSYTPPQRQGSVPTSVFAQHAPLTPPQSGFLPPLAAIPSLAEEALSMLEAVDPQVRFLTPQTRGSAVSVASQPVSACLLAPCKPAPDPPQPAELTFSCLLRPVCRIQS
jgi:hypothetical protein